MKILIGQILKINQIIIKNKLFKFYGTKIYCNEPIAKEGLKFWS